MITPEDIVYYIRNMPRIEFERCPCGHPGCSDYHLKGIGKFVQGSGFTREEAVLITGLLNIEREKFLKMAPVAE